MGREKGIALNPVPTPRPEAPFEVILYSTKLYDLNQVVEPYPYQHNVDPSYITKP